MALSKVVPETTARINGSTTRVQVKSTPYAHCQKKQYNTAIERIYAVNIRVLYVSSYMVKYRTRLV